jgi:hypothetical protein
MMLFNIIASFGLLIDSAKNEYQWRFVLYYIVFWCNVLYLISDDMKKRLHLMRLYRLIKNDPFKAHIEDKSYMYGVHSDGEYILSMHISVESYETKAYMNEHYVIPEFNEFKEFKSDELSKMILDEHPQFMNLQQEALWNWQTRNFGEHSMDENLKRFALGVAEETGELCHCVLKHVQKIREGKNGLPVDLIVDAVADIWVYSLQLLSTINVNASTALPKIFNKVLKRNWIEKKDMAAHE